MRGGPQVAPSRCTCAKEKGIGAGIHCLWWRDFGRNKNNFGFLGWVRNCGKFAVGCTCIWKRCGGVVLSMGNNHYLFHSLILFHGYSYARPFRQTGSLIGGVVTLQPMSPGGFPSPKNPRGVDHIKSSCVCESFGVAPIPAYPSANFALMH